MDDKLYKSLLTRPILLEEEKIKIEKDKNSEDKFDLKNEFSYFKQTVAGEESIIVWGNWNIGKKEWYMPSSVRFNFFDQKEEKDLQFNGNEESNEPTKVK
jgi:hypothetical protein